MVCLGSIGIAGKHALRLPSVETAGCIAHSREDVVLSVYTGGVAMDILLVVAVHILQLDAVVGGAGQRGHLVVVVAYSGTQLPLPVLLVDECGIHLGFKALVGHATLVGPVLVDTAHILQFLQGEQVIGLVPEEVESGMQAVVEEAALDANVPLGGGFPLDGTVLDVLQIETYGVLGHLLALPIGAGCIVVEDSVVTVLLHTGSELQVLHALACLEPRLTADEPAQLQRREHAPAHTTQLESALGLVAETAARLAADGEVGKVAVLVVVAGIQIVGHVNPVVVGTVVVDVLHVLAQVGQFVVLVVVTAHAVVAV